MFDAGGSFQTVAGNRTAPDRGAQAGGGTRSSEGLQAVMVVDDDEGVRKIASTMLRHGGYTVLAAADGPEALALAERDGRKLTLLLTDILMPEMDGHELARRMRALRPEVRVLLMSGASSHGTDVLTKPFTMRALLEAVRRKLSE